MILPVSFLLSAAALEPAAETVLAPNQPGARWCIGRMRLRLAFGARSYFGLRMLSPAGERTYERPCEDGPASIVVQR